MHKKLLYFITIFLVIQPLFFTVSAVNNTSQIPDNETAPETYKIGDVTLTHDEAVGVFIFVVILVIVIAVSMKTAKR